MKNLLPLISMLFLMAACKTTTQPERNIKLLADSTVFSNNNVYTDAMSGTVKEEVKVTPPETKVVYVTKYIPRESREETVSHPAQPEASTPPIIQQDNGNVNPSSNTGNQEENAGEVQKEKKGWSKAAQGAVIGGAAGAVAGAIISKKKGLGAAIGAVVGAAGGYIIGKSKDKKEKANNPFVME